MNSSDEENTAPFIRVPRVLHSSDTGKPFSECMVCNKYLLDDGTPYLIEKAVRQIREMKVREVIFEYAMCMGCAIKMNASMSVESRERINAYFQAHADFDSRREQLLEQKTLRVRPWINHCLIKKTPISRTSEYQIVAQCDGKHLVFTHLPFALSMEAIDEMSGLLSEKSLGEIDDFMGKYFTGPPEVSAILKRRLIFI